MHYKLHVFDDEYIVYCWYTITDDIMWQVYFISGYQITIQQWQMMAAIDTIQIKTNTNITGYRYEQHLSV